MNDAEPTFADYYQRETAFLHRMAGEFALFHPAEAALLGLDPKKPSDPHVDRLLDGFALLSARIHERLDSSYPEIVDGILETLFPGLLSPRPSRTVVQFLLDANNSLSASGVDLPKGTRLRSVSPRDSSAPGFRFKTSYPSKIWPLRVSSVAWNPEVPEGVLEINKSNILCVDLKTIGRLPIRELQNLNPVRFFLNSLTSTVVSTTLYELLLGNCVQIYVQTEFPSAKVHSIGARRIRPVGFEKDEMTLSGSAKLFWGAVLWQEYFEFAEKFLFFDLDLSSVPPFFSNTDADTIRVLFVFSQFDRPERLATLERQITPACLKLGCSPVTNLYEAGAEPILLDAKRYEYPVIVPQRYGAGTEVVSVDRVTRRDSLTGEEVQCLPLLSSSAARHSAPKNATFWRAMRRTIPGSDELTAQTLLTFTNPLGAPLQNSTNLGDSISVWCTCSDGAWPVKYAAGEFTIGERPQIATISAVLPLKYPSYAGSSKMALRRLISNCTANFLSISDGGVDALRAMLGAYSFGGSHSAHAQITAMSDVSCRAVLRQIRVLNRTVLAQGTQIRVSFTERSFDDAGASLYLFACILDRFLGLYTAQNSFTQLQVESDLRPRPLPIWPPRCGWKKLV